MLKLKDIQKSKNVAELLDEQELAAIAQSVIQGYELDEDSRSDWSESIEQAMEIAKQVTEPKSHPWPGAANVKFPLITQASIDYGARTLPEIIQNDRIVKMSIIGQDLDGAKRRRAERVATYMGYQLLQESPDWEDHMDKLLQILPIVGTVFKKTYFSPLERRVISEMCVPNNIVVNYNTKSLETARRVTHKMCMYQNDIVERIRLGVFSDIDINVIPNDESDVQDSDPAMDVLEQHCYLDLDEDGYKEPYVVTVLKDTGEVLRIIPRFKKVERNSKGEVQRIEALQYFTDFHFIRSPDGGYYSIGFGTLLLPINKSINTLINQLLDAGTLSNSQGGFLGKGLRLRNGDFRTKMGEWKVLDAASGINISQNVVPLPTREPSGTLFQLLGLLMQVGKDLTSVSDIMQGKAPPPNTAQGTAGMMLEQGAKVFNAINKRVYRGMSKEYKKIYALNQKYLKDEEYKRVIDDPEANKQMDFEDGSFDIFPVADPTMASQGQRLARSQAIMQAPGVHPYAASKYYLESLQLHQSQIDELLPPPNPQEPPPPETMKIVAEIGKLEAEAESLKALAQEKMASLQLAQTKLAIQRDEALVRAQESSARIMKMKQDAAEGMAKVQLAGSKANHQATMNELDHAHKKEKDELDLTIRASEVAGKNNK